MKLHYDAPARAWEETLPVGNGSLGAMVWGGTDREVLGLNEESLWSGYPRDKNNPGARAFLEPARRLVFSGQYAQAEKLIQDHMLGEYGESYLPLGNLILETAHFEVSEYGRTLDLGTAVATVEYLCGGHSYRREVFASYPHRALFVRWTCDGPHLEATVSLESQLEVRTRASARGLEIRGQCPEHVDPSYVGGTMNPVVQGTRGLPVEARLTVARCDGKVTGEGGKLRIQGASDVVLVFSAVRPPHYLEDSYEAALARHQKDYDALYTRVNIDLGPQLDLPTDRRLERLQTGASDPGLFALYFQYARYLLIASSREGSLPANLQGIWSWELRAPWSSNWTTNINVQMNYWLAQVANLKECLPPYFDLLAKLVTEGRKTAVIHYGCRGFVHHHNADYWAGTAPMGIVHGEAGGRDGTVTWSFWPMGGAWMTSELWRHYEYNPDQGFLRDTAFPILREAALFLVDWLVEDRGRWTTCPSTSPENRFIIPEGTSAVGHSGALDLTLVREVFGNFQQACRILAVSDPLLEEIEDKLARLAPVQTGSRGQMLEWHREFEEVEPGHRHLSHLYGLFPSELFQGDARLTSACRISLQERLAAGSGHTGWSCAWVINLFAVLGDGENVGRYLRKMLVDSTLPNLWDNHPPFQIDGNFGGAAGIANMLVQDRGGQVKWLPALPPDFPEGSVSGLRIKGGKTVSLSWKNGMLTDSQVY